jgi:hypothetical protein
MKKFSVSEPVFLKAIKMMFDMNDSDLQKNWNLELSSRKSYIFDFGGSPTTLNQKSIVQQIYAQNHNSKEVLYPLKGQNEVVRQEKKVNRKLFKCD